MTDIAHLRQWQGRSETVEDHLAAAHAGRLAATLDRAAPAEGDDLPPLWHWAFFTPRAAQADLGADGHPRLGDFLPPVPLPRRMWAGGRLKFHAPLRVGESVTHRTEILSVSGKSGRQGALVFLTLRHVLSNAAGTAIEEEQDIVYRGASTTARPAASGTPLPPADWRERIQPDPALLFRYSAVTFNAHRIHYDLPYATGVEGYPALVVQGPLTATLLMACFLRQTGARPRGFAFRGLAPLFCDGEVTLCGRRTAEGYDLWAEGPGGYAAMSATVSV